MVIGAPRVSASAFATANRSLMTSDPDRESALTGATCPGSDDAIANTLDQPQLDGTTRTATPASSASAGSDCPSGPSWRTTSAAGPAAAIRRARADVALTPTARTSAPGSNTGASSGS